MMHLVGWNEPINLWTMVILTVIVLFIQLTIGIWIQKNIPNDSIIGPLVRAVEKAMERRRRNGDDSECR